MTYYFKYDTPLGRVTVAGCDKGITGLWFDGQKYYGAGLAADSRECEADVFVEAKKWLNIYFSGRNPDFTPPLLLSGSSFRMAVWDKLKAIPYGTTVTYGEIARSVAAKTGARVSAQAVGGAVGRNPVSIIVPCHRVVGADGSLTGYAGGVDKKLALLKIEGADVSRFFLPSERTAL